LIESNNAGNMPAFFLHERCVRAGFETVIRIHIKAGTASGFGALGGCLNDL